MNISQLTYSVFQQSNCSKAPMNSRIATLCVNAATIQSGTASKKPALAYLK